MGQKSYFGAGSTFEAKLRLTDSEGYFQFKNAFAICRQGCRTIKVDESYTTEKPVKDWSVTVTSPKSLAVLLTDEKSVPFYRITVTLTEKTKVVAETKPTADTAKHDATSGTPSPGAAKHRLTV